MSDTSQPPVDPGQTDITYYAKRPSAALDEVVLQADYCTRSMISFWRFRELGGGRRNAGEQPPGLGSHSGAGIHYVSDHPDVRLLSLSFVFLLVIFESAANAYFFAQESEFGLFGGVFQAAAVSLANVAVSYFIIGYWGLRHVSIPLKSGSEATHDSVALIAILFAIFGSLGAAYTATTLGMGLAFFVSCIIAAAGVALLFFFQVRDSRVYIKGFGLFAIVMGLIIVLLVNLSAAHYRNILDLQAMNVAFPEGLQTTTFPRFFIDASVCTTILESDLGETIGSAATNAMCRPFALHSLDAMVLFALGLAISALAAFEGRKADSSFPGLSDAARHFEKARQDLQYALEDYYESYEDIVEMIQDDLGEGANLTPQQRVDLRKALDANVDEYRALLTTADKLLADEFDVQEDVIRYIRAGSKGHVGAQDA